MRAGAAASLAPAFYPVCRGRGRLGGDETEKAMRMTMPPRARGRNPVPVRGARTGGKPSRRFALRESNQRVVDVSTHRRPRRSARAVNYLQGSIGFTFTAEREEEHIRKPRVASHPWSTRSLRPACMMHARGMRRGWTWNLEVLGKLDKKFDVRRVG